MFSSSFVDFLTKSSVFKKHFAAPFFSCKFLLSLHESFYDYKAVFQPQNIIPKAIFLYSLPVLFLFCFITSIFISLSVICFGQFFFTFLSIPYHTFTYTFTRTYTNSFFFQQKSMILHNTTLQILQKNHIKKISVLYSR